MRAASPLMFALALICFALPFAQLSCAGQHAITISGQEMVTGTTMHRPVPGFDAREPHFSGRQTAQAAFVAGLVGLVASLFRGRWSQALAAASAIASAGSLLALRLLAPRDLPQNPGDPLGLRFLPPFYAALVLFLAAGIVSANAWTRPTSD